MLLARGAVWLLLPLLAACTPTSIGTDEVREEPAGAVQVLNSRGVPRVSATWLSPDTIAVTTWGSSSCATRPVEIERSGAHEVAVRVRRTEDAAGCTADAAPTTNQVRLPRGISDDAALDVVIDDGAPTAARITLPSPIRTDSRPAPTLAAVDATASFTVRYSAPGPVDPTTAERVGACLALPGVFHGSKATTPPVHGATVTGSGEAAAFAACVRGLSGNGVTLTEHRPPPLETEADIAAFVESCAYGRQATPVAGFVGMTQAEVLAPDVDSRILGQDGICNPGSPVPDPSIVDVVIADGVVVWAGHLEVPGQRAPVPSQAGELAAGPSPSSSP